MPTPSIQTLRADAQQVLNLDSISAVRSVVAASLANANAGTPLNPNLTTQQLWNEFYQIVTQPKSDIESIIANQLMKFLYAPPAPGGAGANKQVIFNDNGILAGDAGLTYDKATDSLTISGDLTVDTSTLKVDSANNRVGIGITAPGYNLHVGSAAYASVGTSIDSITQTSHIFKGTPDAVGYEYAKILSGRESSPFTYGSFLAFYTEGKNSGTTDTSTERYKIDSTGIATWSNVGGVAGTAMTLNATGLGVGVVPSTYKLEVGNGGSDTRAVFNPNNAFAIGVKNGSNQLGGWIGSSGNNILTFSGNDGTMKMTIDNTGNVGIGVTPITSHILSCSGPVGITGTLAGSRTSYITNASAASIYYTDGGGSGYFTDFGNLIIQPRTSAARSVVIATGSTTPVERAVVKSTGQVRFVPLAADPAGAEAGDVYYNSTSNKLKCYNGTTWNDLF